MALHIPLTDSAMGQSFYLCASIFSSLNEVSTKVPVMIQWYNKWGAWSNGRQRALVCIYLFLQLLFSH